MQNPWEQQQGEADEWYARFVRYLEQSGRRSVARAAAGEPDGPKPRRWQEAARIGRWAGRAHAWDAAGRPPAAAPQSAEDDALRAERLRRRRLDIIERLLDTAAKTLARADLETVDAAEARAMLPNIRLLLRDLLAAQRLESPRPQPQPARSPVHIEDLAAAAEAMEEKKLIPPLEAEPAAPRLLVADSGEPGVGLDMAALRRVGQSGRLSFKHLSPCRKHDLEQELRRAHRNGKPYRFLHLDAHMGPGGVALADGVVDGAWLSERLGGVEVLLLSGCESAAVGDWLRVAPYVVSFAAPLQGEDAAAFAEGFWAALLHGARPDEAVAAALARCLPYVAEHVTVHW